MCVWCGCTAPKKSQQELKEGEVVKYSGTKHARRWWSTIRSFVRPSLFALAPTPHHIVPPASLCRKQHRKRWGDVPFWERGFGERCIFLRGKMSSWVFICVCASLCVRVVKRNQSMGCWFGGHGNGATRFRRAVRKRFRFHNTSSIEMFLSMNCILWWG